jgi:hypothetical protein
MELFPYAEVDWEAISPNTIADKYAQRFDSNRSVVRNNLGKRWHGIFWSHFLIKCT